MVAQIPSPVEAVQRYSLAEYLAQEEVSDRRHEYIDGVIVPMTGGTPNHNRIIRNLCALLTLGLRDRPCEVFVADQRVWIPPKRIYAYPDIFVVQGELQLQDGRNDTITNPAIVIEVLSESTRADDKDGKFAAYRTLPSVQEYVLVDQYQPQIEQYVRLDMATVPAKWSFLDYNGLDGVFSLATVPFDLAIAEIYNQVEFATVADG